MFFFIFLSGWLYEAEESGRYTWKKKYTYSGSFGDIVGVYDPPPVFVTLACSYCQLSPSKRIPLVFCPFPYHVMPNESNENVIACIGCPFTVLLCYLCSSEFLTVHLYSYLLFLWYIVSVVARNSISSHIYST